MNVCVVDASVAIKWYVPEIHSEAARTLLLRQIAGDLTIHFPDLCFAEVGNVLCKRVRRQEIDADRAWAIATEMVAVPRSVYASGPLLPAALDLALTTGRSLYDSLYLSLADSLRCPLVTADARLRNALSGSRWQPVVRWIEDV